MKYYILKNEVKEGPFDFIALITKINKGEVSETTLISTDENENPVPAGELQEFETSFSGKHGDEEIDATGLDISQAMKNSKFFVLENITTVPIVTGVFLLFMVLPIILGNYLFAEIGAIVGVAISYMFLGIYSFYIVEKTQGLVDVNEIIKAAKSGALHLLLAGVIFAIPPVLMVSALSSLTGNFYIIAFAVSAIALIELMISTFVPFLIIEKKKNLFEAFKLSIEATAGLRKPDLIRIIFVNLLLVLATMAIGLPLLFVLPFAFATFAEVYQSLFLYKD